MNRTEKAKKFITEFVEELNKSRIEAKLDSMLWRGFILNLNELQENVQGFDKKFMLYQKMQDLLNLELYEDVLLTKEYSMEKVKVITELKNTEEAKALGIPTIFPPDPFYIVRSPIDGKWKELGAETLDILDNMLILVPRNTFFQDADAYRTEPADDYKTPCSTNEDLLEVASFVKEEFTRKATELGL